MANTYIGADVEDFIFGEGAYEDNDNYSDISDEEMNEFGVMECFDEPDVACYRIALENEQNYNAIMTAIAEQEIGYVEEGFKESLADAKQKMKDIAAAVRKQIMKFWAKVKGVFKKVTDILTSLALSNKGFIKKYQPIASKIAKPKKPADFNIMEIGDTTIDYANAVVVLHKYIDAASDNFKKFFATGTDISYDESLKTKREITTDFRSALIGGNATGEADKWDSEIKSHLYKNDGKPVKASSASIPLFADILKQMEDNAMEKKYAKDAYKTAEKSIKENLRAVKQYETQNITDETSKKYAEKRIRLAAECITASLSIMSSALSYQTKAITTRAHQNRKLANWYVRGQKIEGFKESAVSTSLSDIELV